MSAHMEMDARLQKNENTQAHFHPEVELHFVVDGSAVITIKDTSWSVGKDEFILINAGMPHSVSCDTKDTILCRVSFSCRSISEMSGEEMNLFDCCSPNERDPKYHEMRRILHELVYLLVQRPHKTACLKQSVLYKLMDCLLEYFTLDTGRMDTVPEDDVKVMQIFQYINQNYAYNVSLTELADRMYMAKSTLSRFFKKQTGVYFADYVNMVRLKYAMEDLIYTDKNITKIAVDNGFSNPSAFNKIFREQYGTVPTEYRARERRKHAAEEAVRTDEDLHAELREKLALEENAVPDNVRVRTDMTGGAPFPKKWGQCINVGSAFSLTTNNLRRHTLYLKDQLGFTHARIWSVFSSKLTITDGKRMGYYNYDMIDGVLDFLVSNHIRPVLDFGNRPDTATYAPGNPVFCETEYVPFASREVWEDLVRDFFLHITNRYGETETSHWIFEFSYSHSSDSKDTTRAYYAGGDFRYCEAFAYAYRTIKRYLPEAKVGGPMSEVEPEYMFLAEFLSYCRENRCMPDFVSFMLFPYHTEVGDESVSTVRATTERSELEQVAMMRRVLWENGAEDCELYITEWNNSLSNRNYLNDSCSRAAYMVKKLSEIVDQVDMIAVWMASDWMCSYFDTVSIANGGGGILTKDSIRKPAYYAMDFLQRMGDTLLEKGANYLITKKQNREYYILCYNYKWFAVNYFVQEEGIRDPESLFEIFEDKNVLELEFCLENMPADREYIVKRRTVNEDYGSLLTEWRNFQYEKKLRNSDINYIREACIPKVHMSRMRATDGRIRLNLSLKPHEITLIHIYEEA